MGVDIKSESNKEFISIGIDYECIVSKAKEEKGLKEKIKLIFQFFLGEAFYLEGGGFFSIKNLRIEAAAGEFSIRKDIDIDKVDKIFSQTFGRKKLSKKEFNEKIDEIFVDRFFVDRLFVALESSLNTLNTNIKNYKKKYKDAAVPSGKPPEKKSPAGIADKNEIKEELFKALESSLNTLKTNIKNYKVESKEQNEYLKKIAESAKEDLSEENLSKIILYLFKLNLSLMK